MKNKIQYIQGWVLLFAFGPLIIGVLGSFLGMIFVCRGGGDAYNCAIGGYTTGEIIWTMEMLHWFTLFTAPIGLAVFFILAIVKFFIKEKPQEGTSQVVAGSYEQITEKPAETK